MTTSGPSDAVEHDEAHAPEQDAGADRGPTAAQELEDLAREVKGALTQEELDAATDAALGAADTIADQPPLTAEELADLIALVFELVAMGRGDHWNLREPEKKRIGHWLKKVVDRHGLAWLGKYLPDVIAGALLTAAVYRRIQLDKQLGTKKPAAAAAPAPVGEIS